MQVLILQQEALHACSQVTCDEQLLHFLSRLKWSGLLKWGVQTPDQVSSISVVWNTQADQNLSFSLPKKNDHYSWALHTYKFRHRLDVLEKGDEVLAKSHLTLTADELTGSMAISLRHKEPFLWYCIFASCTTSHLNTKRLRGLRKHRHSTLRI